jgi:hypothetical protein
LGEYLTASLSMEIVVYDYAFSEDHQSILHALPPLVLETTYALRVFLLSSKLICPTSYSNMGFL